MAKSESQRKFFNPLSVVLLLSASFFGIFLLVSGILFVYKSPTGSAPKTGASVFFGGGAIGVLELNGVILDSKRTLARLNRLVEDSEIKGIVLRLNSPGGAVAPSQEIYEAVKKIKKPVVVSMGNVAASGAYYIACAANKVYANPGTITGSIGVIMEFLNLEKLYEWAKVKRFSIKTGKFKDAGAEYRSMAPEERALLQGMVDDVLGQFKRAVMEGRKLSAHDVSAIADGRIFSGSQAKAVHLVDELGTLQDAIDAVAVMAKIRGKPSVVYPEKPKRHLWETLLETGDSGRDDAEGESLLGGLSALVRGTRSAEVSATLGLSPGIYWLWSGAH